MAGEALEFFTELMFGSGGWLGLILIVILLASITYKIKEAGYVSLVIAVFLALEYFENVDPSTNFYWSGVLMLLFGVSLAVSSGYRTVKK